MREKARWPVGMVRSVGITHRQQMLRRQGVMYHAPTVLKGRCKSRGACSCYGSECLCETNLIYPISGWWRFWLLCSILLSFLVYYKRKDRRGIVWRRRYHRPRFCRWEIRKASCRREWASEERIDWLA